MTSPPSLGEPQVKVEALFDVAQPDPLAAARAQRSKLAVARRDVAEARERYLGCATELEIAMTTGAPKERVDELRLRMWKLHTPVREAMLRLDDLQRKPARKRRR